MTLIAPWFICPKCDTEGPHDFKGEGDDMIVTCQECGFEYVPAAEDEDDGEHESSFEEQFENAQFAQDEYPNGYEDDM